MKFYTIEPGEYPDDNRRKDDNEYFSDSWSVKYSEAVYTLTYISGSLQGELKTIEITESDFISAKNGEMSIYDFCIKYNVN